MEQPNQWLTPTEQEELAYMYQQEGGHVPGVIEQQFAEPPPLPEHQEQYYTPPMATPSSFHPSRSSNFPTFGGSSSSLPNLPFGAATVKNEQGQPSPSHSSKFLSFGAGQASTLNFSGGAWQQDDMLEGAMQLQAPAERRGRAPGNAQEHVIAERKRREKLQQQFVSLATIVPGLKKTDKISLLGGTIEYVKQLEEKVQALEEQGARRSSESTVFETKCSISAADSDAAGPSGSGSGEHSSPAVEASVRGNTALLKICCKERRGVLVMVLTELENHGLSIINTNVVPFTDSCLNITITAKIEEGFSSAVELVKNLTEALRSFN
uniref:Uncharacterized protein n=1 Tax=Avena sativa TaxID=4498 RepID=A0ACD5XDR9_AVESA